MAAARAPTSRFPAGSRGLLLIPKQVGCAVAHSSQLVDGVTKIVSGVRYSLTLFFTKSTAGPSG